MNRRDADDWVVRDDRMLDDATAVSAAASQASLGELFNRLRAVRFPEVPMSAGEQGVPPWPT